MKFNSNNMRVCNQIHYTWMHHWIFKSQSRLELHMNWRHGALLTYDNYKTHTILLNLQPHKVPIDIQPHWICVYSVKQGVHKYAANWIEWIRIDGTKQRMIVQHISHRALFFQNIMRVKIFTKVANQIFFVKCRFNAHETTLRIAAFKTRIYCHTILKHHTILQGLLQRTTSFPASHVFE